MNLDRYLRQTQVYNPQTGRWEKTDIYLPPGEFWRRVRATAEHLGVRAATAEDVYRRSADTTNQTQHAIFPHDEREAKYGKPLVYADFSPGKTPIAYVGAGKEHLGDMKDKVDELRHYGEDLPERPEPAPDVALAWQNYVAVKLDRQAGRITPPLKGGYSRKD